MRIETKVKKIGITENGMSLVSKDGTHYHWNTKSYNHDLWFTDDFLLVKLTIVKEEIYGLEVKNVRVMK